MAQVWRNAITGEPDEIPEHIPRRVDDRMCEYLPCSWCGAMDIPSWCWTLADESPECMHGVCHACCVRGKPPDWPPGADTPPPGRPGDPLPQAQGELLDDLDGGGRVVHQVRGL